MGVGGRRGKASSRSHAALTSVSCSLDSQTVSQLSPFPTQSPHFNSPRLQDFSCLGFQNFSLISNQLISFPHAAECSNFLFPCEGRGVGFNWKHY